MRVLIFLLMCLTSALFAQEATSAKSGDSVVRPVSPAQIQIDGQASDWSAVPAVLAEVGVAKPPQGADVTDLRLCWSGDNLAYSFRTNGSAKAFSAPGVAGASVREALLKIAFNVDDNRNTGPQTSKLFDKVPLPGFEWEMTIYTNRNGQLTMELRKLSGIGEADVVYSHESGLLKSDASFVEGVLPLGVLNISSATTVELVAAEAASQGSKEGYNKGKFRLFAAVTNTAKESTINKGAWSMALIVLLLWLVGIFTAPAIERKSGESVAGLAFIPVLGLIIMLYSLAFASSWQVHKDLDHR